MKLTIKQLKTLLTVNEYSTRSQEELNILMDFEKFTNEVVLEAIHKDDLANKTDNLTDGEYFKYAETHLIELDIPHAKELANILSKGVIQEDNRLKEQEDRIKQARDHIEFFKELIKTLEGKKPKVGDEIKKK